ncbi:MAG: Methyltransferase domain [Paenibacillus sp.]|nr:Methyltransferase domain [Paenibacillus sp.]
MIIAQTIADRLIWAVETLEVAPSDRLLEIGCGHESAVSLIFEKLVVGYVTALDRSEKMLVLDEAISGVGDHQIMFVASRSCLLV